MSPRRDSQKLLQRTDRLLALICEVAQDAEALTTAERKQLADMARRARRGDALTAVERARVARYAYKALPKERIKELVNWLEQEVTAPRSRTRRLPRGRGR